MRTDGTPSSVAVASAAASGSCRPAARASLEPALEDGEGIVTETLEPRVHEPNVLAETSDTLGRRWRSRGRSGSRPRCPAPSRGASPSERRGRSRRRCARTSRSSPPPPRTRRSRTSTGTSSSTSPAGSASSTPVTRTPAVVEAIVDQAARFLHTDYTVVPYETYVELAERLCALVPIAGPTRAAFFNAGTEAVENAVKLARLHTGRPGVIAFEGGFHGRTLLSLTLTSKFHPYKAGMGPFAPEVYRAPYPNAYRGPERRRGARRAPARARDARRAGARRRDRLRAPARRRRLRSRAPQAFVEGLRAHLRPARHRPRRRRGADRLRAHRPDVRDGALRGRAGPRHGREVDRRRASRSRA